MVKPAFFAIGFKRRPNAKFKDISGFRDVGRVPGFIYCVPLDRSSKKIGIRAENIY